MATKNNINNKTIGITIDPISSIDSSLQFSVGGVSKFKLGIDDSDSDNFKISSGSALGTNDTMSIKSTGEVLYPLTPACNVGAASTIAENVTGDGTVYTIPYSVERFDQNSDFASNQFVAPVTGKYYITISVYMSTVSGSDSSLFTLKTSNNDFQSYRMDINYYKRSYEDAVTFSYGMLVDMDASDVASATVMLDDGTKVVDVGLGAASTFTACLIC